MNTKTTEEGANEKRMRRNMAQRQRYVEMPPEKKAALLQKNRERYAAKKKKAQLDDSATSSNSCKRVHVLEQRSQTGYINEGIIIKDVDKQNLTGRQHRGPLPNVVSCKGKAQTSSYSSFGIGSLSAFVNPATLSAKEFFSLRNDFPFSQTWWGKHIIQVTNAETSGMLAKRSHVATEETTKKVGLSQKWKRRVLNKDLKKGGYEILTNIVTEPTTLPPAQPCKYCRAKRFYSEPNGFCCSAGEVALISNAIPDKLYNLYTSDSENTLSAAARKKQCNVSCREYYCYKLQIRPNENSIFLRAGRLLQQYVIDI